MPVFRGMWIPSSVFLGGSFWLPRDQISIPLAGFTFLAVLLEHSPSDVDVGEAGCYVVVKCCSYLVVKWLADALRSGRANFWIHYIQVHISILTRSQTHKHTHTHTHTRTYLQACFDHVHTLHESVEIGCLNHL